MDKINKIFLIEETWWDYYKILGCYDNKESALAHVGDPNFNPYHGIENVRIKEYGLRSKKQLKELYERTIYYGKDRNKN